MKRFILARPGLAAFLVFVGGGLVGLLMILIYGPFENIPVDRLFVEGLGFSCALFGAPPALLLHLVATSTQAREERYAKLRAAANPEDAMPDDATRPTS